jgi:hypothetical protein
LRRTFRPSLLGKIATGTFIVTGVVTLYANYLGRRLMVVDVAVWASLVITLLSGLHYIAHAAKLAAHD